MSHKKEMKTCDRCQLSSLANRRDLKKVKMNDTDNILLMCKDCRVWLKGMFTFVKNKKRRKRNVSKR